MSLFTANVETCLYAISPDRSSWLIVCSFRIYTMMLLDEDMHYYILQGVLPSMSDQKCVLGRRQLCELVEKSACFKKKIQHGVKQGCVLSSYLFSLYTEMIMQKLERYPGIKGGHNINDLRWADIILFAENNEDLQRLPAIVEEESRKKGWNDQQKGRSNSHQ